MPYFLIATPPHRDAVDISAIASLLGQTEAETNLQLKYPAAAIWRYSQTQEELLKTCRLIQKYGASCTTTSTNAVFQIPAPLPAVDLKLSPDSMSLRLTTGQIDFNLHAPLLFIEQKPLQVGSEFQKLREKKEARKDKKKRAATTRALLASAPEETSEKTSANHRWIFSQKDASGTLKQAYILPARLSFDILKEKMALNSAENIRRLRDTILQTGSEILHQDGLVNLPYRYPLLFEPSFIQILEAHNIAKDSLSPELLANAVSTASWVASVENGLLHSQ